MQRLVSFSLAAALALVIPSVGSAFTSKRGAKVNLVNSTVFEVVPSNGGDGQVFWCSAADYAQRELRASWNAQLYIARGRGPSVTTGRRSAVQFTLDPQAASVTPIESSLSLNSLKAGENMTVRRAYDFCAKQSIF